MRQEVLVGLALVVGGGTAAAVALAGDSDGTGKSTASTPASGRRQAATQTVPTQTAKAKPATPKLRVRIGGHVVVVPATRIGFRYCRRHVRTCAALRPAQRRKLRRNQRRAVAAARARLRARRAAPAPGPTPAPQPAPAPSAPPAPVPPPHPPPSGETSTA